MLNKGTQKFNKTFHASKGLLVGALLGTVALTSGCTTMVKTLGANYHMMGDKVVRLKVYRFSGDTPVESSARALKASKASDGLFRAYGGVVPSRDMVRASRWIGAVAPGMMWEAATFWGNGPQGPATVLVDDRVPLLHEGDWVDVYVPKKLVMGENRWLTVVRLICKADDKACQKREAGASRKPRGQVVANTYDQASISITPHYDPEGNWLPGKKPSRP